MSCLFHSRPHSQDLCGFFFAIPILLTPIAAESKLAVSCTEWWAEGLRDRVLGEEKYLPVSARLSLCARYQRSMRIRSLKNRTANMAATDDEFDGAFAKEK
jgi:hypothetical protein